MDLFFAKFRKIQAIHTPKQFKFSKDTHKVLLMRILGVHIKNLSNYFLKVRLSLSKTVVF